MMMTNSLVKFIAPTYFLLFLFNSFATAAVRDSEVVEKNVAYVEVNSNDIGNAGCFSQSDGSPLFDIAVIFAANINFDGEKAILWFNPQVTELLDQRIESVRALQNRGIKVVLSVLGNHQNAGWSCFASEDSAADFAQQLKDAVDRYDLDGIDIDDEYSACANTYNDSLVKVTSILREKMPDKIISKALWQDTQYFTSRWQNKTLADNLDYGWEMSYWAGSQCVSRVQPYINRGMDKSKLGVGASTVITDPTVAEALASCVSRNDLGGGMMIFNLTRDSFEYLSRVWPGVQTEPDCLR